MQEVFNSLTAFLGSGFASSLITAFLGSGFAFTALRLIFDKRKEARERSEAAKYLAVQIAFQLEGFTIECANGVSDHQTANNHDGHAGMLLSGVPTPPPLPSSESYRFMEPELLNSVFGFSQRCKLAQLSANFWLDVVGDQDCYQNSVEENTVLMGAESLEIARKIRKSYKLGERALAFGEWNIDEFLRSEMQKVKQKIERREQMGKS
jgi:hypothetical protein